MTSPPVRAAGGWFRPKRHLSRRALSVLGLLAALPLLSVLIRSLAAPVVMGPVFDQLREVGTLLSQILSLNAIPPDQRDHVLYLLLLPTCALLVALARLTFGIRVLGFRSILIAVGFHQSGVIPSLLLITVAVATIVLVRPWLRAIRLPYYGRVSVILCVVATTMVAGVVVGPWVRSDVIWGAAYFPVIVLGMLAEGIAHTLDRDHAITAWWRAITTILLAFLIALVCWTPALRSLMLQFPELVVTQIVAIVMISEFLDLRLLQDWDQRVAARLPGPSAARPGRFRVAVVRNRVEPAPGEAPDPGRRQALHSVLKIVRALRAGHYQVRVLEGDATLPRMLRRFLPPAPSGGEARGMVLNLAHGLRGDAPATHVPAMLELAGIPYAGPSPRGYAVALDRLAALSLMRDAGVPVPAFQVMSGPDDPAPDLDFPVMVRPRHEPRARPRTVSNRPRLRAAVRRMLRRWGQDVVVEERVQGRRIVVGVLGNDPVECLALVELDETGRDKVCPARLEGHVAKRIRTCATAAFRACGGRDYARVEVRLAAAGELRVIEVATLGILARRGAFALAGETSGYSFRRLIGRIVEVARRRERRGQRGRRRRQSRAEAPAVAADVTPPPALRPRDRTEVAS